MSEQDKEMEAAVKYAKQATEHLSASLGWNPFMQARLGFEAGWKAASERKDAVIEGAGRTLARMEADIEDAFERGLLEGSAVGDATAKRFKEERDADMSRLQAERISFVQERDRLQSKLDAAYTALSELAEDAETPPYLRIWANMHRRGDAK